MAVAIHRARQMIYIEFFWKRRLCLYGFRIDEGMRASERTQKKIRCAQCFMQNKPKCWVKIVPTKSWKQIAHSRLYWTVCCFALSARAQREGGNMKNVNYVSGSSVRHVSSRLWAVSPPYTGNSLTLNDMKSFSTFRLNRRAMCSSWRALFFARFVCKMSSRKAENKEKLFRGENLFRSFPRHSKWPNQYLRIDALIKSYKKLRSMTYGWLCCEHCESNFLRQGNISPLGKRERKTFGTYWAMGACQQRKMSKQSVDVYEQIPSTELFNRRKRIETRQRHWENACINKFM